MPNMVADKAHNPKRGRFAPCSFCGFALAKRRHCPCKQVQYCDDICQMRAWKSHKHECTKRGVDMASKLLRNELCKDCVDYIIDEFLG